MSTHNALLLPAGLLLDQLLGEPRRFHPLVGFGRLANAVERRLNGADRFDAGARRLLGAAGMILLVAPLVAAAIALADWGSRGDWMDGPGGPWLVGVLFELLILQAALGLQSLAWHAAQVVEAFRAEGLPAARERVGWLVSRETSSLDEAGVARAGCESMLENGCDAVFATLFWFLVAGAPGALAHRLVNTLDAMWGYRNDRFAAFGWAAARLDDLMNWIPARLTALTYALMGNTGEAFAAWRALIHWKSPNAGVVMAAGAGALGLRLGGGAVYHGQPQTAPTLGLGRPPRMADLAAAVGLVRRGAALWGAAALILGALTLVQF